MSNPKLKSVPASASDTASKTVEQVAQLVEMVLQFRGIEKPALGENARVSSRAAGLLRLKGDEKSSIENAATMQIARAHNLVG
jgi:hypothetical protein